MQSVMEEGEAKRSAWESEIGEFRMDPLFEMTLGERKLSLGELRELQAGARAGQARIDEIRSEVLRSAAESEGCIAHVSTKGASDFRLGFETRRPAMEELFKLAKKTSAL